MSDIPFSLEYETIIASDGFKRLFEPIIKEFYFSSLRYYGAIPARGYVRWSECSHESPHHAKIRKAYRALVANDFYGVDANRLANYYMLTKLFKEEHVNGFREKTRGYYSSRRSDGVVDSGGDKE